MTNTQCCKLQRLASPPPAPAWNISVRSRKGREENAEWWLPYLLVVILFYSVGGSIPLPPKLFGEVTSPLYPKPYPNNFETTTVITVPQGYRVKLVFWHFDLEPSEGCFYDYVKISADKKSLGRLCGQLGSPLGNPPGKKEFISQGNKMLLTFHTDFSNEENGTIMFYKGFLAYYQAVDLDECASQLDSVSEDPQPRCQHLCHNYVGGYFCSCRPGYELLTDGHSCQAECSSDLYTEPSGYISSLEYPRPYPSYLRCNYSIRVERGLTLHLKFLEPFEIDDHQQVKCPYDQLQIYANGKNIGEFCGTQRPPDLDTSSNAVDLLFFTDDSGDSRGWKLHYTTETIKCPQPKTLDEFTIIQNLQPKYQFRDYFIASCKQGYQLMEGKQALLSFTAVCQDDGTWHRAMPKCKIKDCGQPRSLSNGYFNYITKKGVNTYQAHIQYYCNEPYYKMQTRAESDESKRGMYTCTAQGIWKNEHEGEKIPLCLPVCGKPVNPVEQRQRIIGGQKAQMGNFPWQAFTYIYGRGGGALLGDRWILTAAHTLYPKEHEAQSNATVDVFLGHTNVEEITKLGNYPIRRVSIHPDYRQDESNNFEGDIALLELENSVTLGPNLLPICLPDNETLYDEGRMGYVSGFGITEEKIASHLRFVSLPVAKREACENWLQKKKRNDVFSQSMFCAGDPSLKQDSCQGDSGGVFAVRDTNSDRWVATGIVSWGIGCSKGYGFYTKLLNYVDWIKKEMEEEG
ncbi:complement C1r subcomponent [Orycteropus afer afer]|uniref:Complement C1r subcomponent n=1 Tax=Orycteropus afer afer TaxID=1230840 RepID=A0A8B6ZJW2_ORYAF|nr:complement C1r subcomponent [Orycteropus afer afer]